MASGSTQAKQTAARPNGRGAEQQVRIQCELPRTAYRRFKAQCILSETTIAKEVRRFVEARVEVVDAELTEVLHVPVSPALKEELVTYAASRRRKLAEVLLDGFAMLRRARPAKEPEETGGRPAAGARNGAD